ncbi:MAG TPA: hypothetical protein ENI94_01215 [Gammaproteobacteria bacterium]|nr:hypothetical protein [Gammaproteobacteria bacterium]
MNSVIERYLKFLVLMIAILFSTFSLITNHAIAKDSQKTFQIAGLDTPDGPPPCGQDGQCNLATCPNDPDCPPEPEPPESTSGSSGTSDNLEPSRASDIKNCTTQETTEIGFAIDWGADNWAGFETALESIRDWPVKIGGCLKNRFKKNGKVVCEDSMKGKCNGNNGWAAALNRKCHMCPDFLDKIRAISGVENRQACYFALVTHEWGHTCERGHKTLEIIDDEAFNFWKSNHPGVTINFNDCGMQ